MAAAQKVEFTPWSLRYGPRNWHVSSSAALKSTYQSEIYRRLPEFTELVKARVSSIGNMPCYGFSRSLLWQLVSRCQVWATSSLTYNSSKITPTHVLHLGFLKRLLGVKKSTDTYCVLRETGQMPIFFYWFRCIIRFWTQFTFFKQSSS